MACIHTDGFRHDCQYVTLRNRLIPTAEELAADMVKALDEGHDKDLAFGVAFLRAMDSLWAARGAAAS